MESCTGKVCPSIAETAAYKRHCTEMNWEMLSDRSLSIGSFGEDSSFGDFFRYSLSAVRMPQKEKNMVNHMVISSEIEWIGYEHKDRMLQVEFIEGPVYRYQEVPRSIFEEFLQASSHGRYFETNVKGKFEHRRIR